MKKSIIMASMVIFFALASCEYDSTEIEEEIDKVEAELEGLEQRYNELIEQLEAYSALINSSFISYIGTDADGNYVISYIDSGGEVKTVTLALGSDVVTSQLIGTATYTDGIVYWRMTADNGETWEWITDSSGNMMPVTGSVPEVGIDDEGYWTVNGERITDSDGNPVLASDITNSLFTGVEYDESTGLVTFTLSDGSSFSVQMYEALSISFDSATFIAIEDRSTPAVITYTVSGSLAESAEVDYFTAYNVSVSIDTYKNTISVTLDDDAADGNTVIIASAGSTTVLKPLFFTYGTAEINTPTWDSAYGTGTEIELPGEETAFEISVSHNIDYVLTISEDCQDWLTETTTKSTTTSTHSFVASEYENTLGADRTGVLTFTNTKYEVSVEVTVRQSPKEEEESDVKGISTGNDLVAFAKAVNAGTSLSSWTNDDGEIALLNDIDLTGLTEWTPIGRATNSGTSYDDFEVSKAFTGTFNGGGYTISGIQWTYDTSDDYQTFALFGALDGATIKDLTFGADGDMITVTGSNSTVVAVAAVVGYASGATITNVKNNVDVVLTGDDPAGTPMILGGVAGVGYACTIGGKSKSLAVTNNGDVYTGSISNTENGSKGMQIGGVCTVTLGGGMTMTYCVNNGSISAATGRGGGLIGTIAGSTTEAPNITVSNCTNYGTIQDDVVGQFDGSSEKYNLKRMGGLVGGTVTNNDGISIESCTNYGNVFSQIGCRCGGFVGHNQASITGCTNQGIILSDITYSGGEPQHGPGWACGYSGSGLVTSCTKGGKVGEWSTYKDNPEDAPDATDDNALCYKNSEYYDPDANN